MLTLHLARLETIVDLLGQQIAVLEPAFGGVALDVQVDPTGLLMPTAECEPGTLLVAELLNQWPSVLWLSSSCPSWNGWALSEPTT